MTVEERVAKGAELLDKKVPGWEEKIDLNELKLDDCWDCIIGQVLGHYSKENLATIGLRLFESASEHGFSYWSLTLEEHHELEAAWTKLILERRAQK